MVGGVHLGVVVAAALHVPDLVVGHVLDHQLGRGALAEEVVPDVAAGLALVGLEVAVRRLVHDPDQVAGAVGGEERVPLPTPQDLDHVPAGAAEEGLELLDDLAVAAHRAVEPLQVAVDHEGQVVQTVVGGQLQQTARLGLVHLAVTEERPDVLVGGVLDAAVAQVAVELGLVDRVHRADAHRDRGELPELRHQPRVRVRRQPVRRLRLLLPEPVQVLLAQPTLEVGPGVHARRGVALEEHLVAAAGVVGSAEEVVQADLVQRGRAGVGGDVPTDADVRALGPVHQHRGVPADQAAVTPLDLLVTGELRLVGHRDGVDVVGDQRRGGRATGAAGPFVQRRPGSGGPGPGRGS